jgi:hypothetical protein
MVGGLLQSAFGLRKLKSALMTTFSCRAAAFSPGEEHDWLVSGSTAAAIHLEPAPSGLGFQTSEASLLLVIAGP